MTLVQEMELSWAQLLSFNYLIAQGYDVIAIIQ